jgi:hypothetical protein
MLNGPAIATPQNVDDKPARTPEQLGSCRVRER